MLERLEREHKTRLEKQQQEYEDYMHDLEDKMKRRFDDYLTLTNGYNPFLSDFSSPLSLSHLVFKNLVWIIMMIHFIILVEIHPYPSIPILADIRVILRNIPIDP